MSVSYSDYRDALIKMRDLPGQNAADLDQVRQARARAEVLADDARSAAEIAASAAMKAIEAQLAAARTALEPLGRANLIPPRILPSGGTTTASREDVSRAQRALTAAVDRLRQASSAELQRAEDERRRLARQEAERARLAREAAERAAAAARTRRLVLIVGMSIVAIAVLVMLLTGSL